MLAEGEVCGLHRIERLMRQQALRARPRRRRMPIDTGSPVVGRRQRWLRLVGQCRPILKWRLADC